MVKNHNKINKTNHHHSSL